VGFTICTHTTSLTFDLTLDQEKLPRNRKKTFHREKKRKESFRRATEEDPSATPPPALLSSFLQICSF